MRTSFSKLSLLALPLAALTACQDYEPFSEAEVAQNMYNRDYNKAFVDAFGTIDPDQEWGFGLLPMGGQEIEATRGSNTNSNEWVSVYHYEVPGVLEPDQNKPWGWSAGNISNYERAYVYWWFSTHQWPQPVPVNWSDFFMQNVWGQPEHSNYYADGSQWEGSLNLGMDDMHILNKGAVPSNPPLDIVDVSSAKNHIINNLTNYLQINNYNAGGGGSKEQVMYVYDSSTNDFTYKGSFKDEAHNNWTIQYINGNYYLAFDYWHDKGNNDDYAQMDPDGYYNDWILKLYSGTHKVDGFTRRVMCEDLGNTFDWDFNDVVFDVTAFVENGKNYAMITLQAAGGTMPIYVGDLDHEAHEMFGVATTVPVNVDADGGVKRPAVVYRIELKDDQVIKHEGKLYCKTNSIPVYVPSRSNQSDNNDGGASQVRLLTAEKGEAPQKFSCPSNTYWLKEFQHIEKGHPQFWTWVEDGSRPEENSFVTTDSNPSDFTYLYEDLGKPQAVTYYPGKPDGWNSTDFIEWKTLWNTMVNNNGLDDSQFTQVRTTYKHNNNPVEAEAYKTSFYNQAPYIYETVGQDDDPIAYCAMMMDDILDGNYVNQEIVWQPAIEYTIKVEVSQFGGGTVSGGGTAKKGEYVTIKATPNPNYRFLNWDDGNTDSERSVLVTKNQTYTANFERTYEEFTTTLGTVSEISNGTVLIAADAAAGEYLLEISASASGNFGFNADPFSLYCRDAGTYYTVVNKQSNQAVSVNDRGNVTSVTIKSK